jgi:membrane fusion protein (multidrug efflux system)
MAMRLELTGYRYAYQNLVLDSVAEEVIGPAEARRYLGNQVADALPIDGPVTVVRAQLPGSSFTVDGETFFYHDGMPATAEVRLRSESILLTLVPALRRL